MKRRRRRGLGMVVGTAACLAVAAGIVHVQYAPPDREAGTRGAVIVEIPPRATLRQTAGLLRARHLIRNAGLFEWLARARGLAARIQPGEYALTAAMTPRQILDRLVRGEVVLHPVTIPEGLTVAETLLRLTAAGYGPEEGYRRMLGDPDYQAAHGVPSAGVKVPFEGYLFPDTYLLAKDTPPARVLSVMLARLDAAFTPERRRRMALVGWDRHQVLTLASLIEKETGRPEERARISAVFHNRLERNMRLQADPTVIYAIPAFDGDIRHADLLRDDPYNTYRHRGLPPGPIANPGEAAIQAALFPDDDAALYFVARGDGTHVFSTTVEDHNRAVRQLVR